MKATFYENFEALCLNLNEQRANEKKPFWWIFIFFYLTNRSILMFHISFYFIVNISNTYIFRTEFFFKLTINKLKMARFLA